MQTESQGFFYGIADQLPLSESNRTNYFQVSAQLNGLHSWELEEPYSPIKDEKIGVLKRSSLLMDLLYIKISSLTGSINRLQYQLKKSETEKENLTNRIYQQDQLIKELQQEAKLSWEQYNSYNTIRINHNQYEIMQYYPTKIIHRIEHKDLISTLNHIDKIIIARRLFKLFKRAIAKMRQNGLTSAGQQTVYKIECIINDCQHATRCVIKQLIDLQPILKYGKTADEAGTILILNSIESYLKRNEHV